MIASSSKAPSKRASNDPRVLNEQRRSRFPDASETKRKMLGVLEEEVVKISLQGPKGIATFVQPPANVVVPTAGLADVLEDAAYRTSGRNKQVYFKCLQNMVTIFYRFRRMSQEGKLVATFVYKKDPAPIVKAAMDFRPRVPCD